MITRKKFQLQVNNGPSKMDLITSLITSQAKAPNGPFKVTFEVEPGQELPQKVISTTGYKYQAVIDGISHEDGSGESFCIKGRLYDNYNGQLKVAISYRFAGYFHTHSREGRLTFTYDYIDNR